MNWLRAENEIDLKKVVTLITSHSPDEYISGVVLRFSSCARVCIRNFREKMFFKKKKEKVNECCQLTEAATRPIFLCFPINDDEPLSHRIFLPFYFSLKPNLCLNVSKFEYFDVAVVFTDVKHFITKRYLESFSFLRNNFIIFKGNLM